MNTLKQSEQAPVPINQPTNFPRFYLIPETSTHQIPSPASNNPIYRQSPPKRIDPPPESAFRKYARQEKEIFQEVCADAWAAIKQAGRDTARWLTWWIILPLSIASTLYIPSIHPMELPL